MIFSINDTSAANTHPPPFLLGCQEEDEVGFLDHHKRCRLCQSSMYEYHFCSSITVHRESVFTVIKSIVYLAVICTPLTFFKGENVDLKLPARRPIFFIFGFFYFSLRLLLLLLLQLLRLLLLLLILLVLLILLLLLLMQLMLLMLLLLLLLLLLLPLMKLLLLLLLLLLLMLLLLKLLL